MRSRHSMLGVLLQGREGADAFFHLWGLLSRLVVAAILLIVVIGIILALEPTS